MTNDGKKLNRRITNSLSIEVSESPSVVMVQSGGSPQGASSRQALRMQEIYLVDLEGSNPYHHDLNARYMDATLIQLIVPAPQGHVNMYHKKDRKISSSAFTRLFMFQCGSGSQLEQNRR
eukprot:12440130-Ditylum_brightwellii.AAC.1